MASPAAPHPAPVKPEPRPRPAADHAPSKPATAAKPASAKPAPAACDPCCPGDQVPPPEPDQPLFSVPEGFQALLKHICRELLNAKPKDPYLYVAEYLRNKVNERRRGVLEAEYFQDDTLNIDLKPAMHYLQQTSLENVTCPSNTAFEAVANDAATTIQASVRGAQGRAEAAEIRRDPDRLKPSTKAKKCPTTVPPGCPTPSELEFCRANAGKK